MVASSRSTSLHGARTMNAVVQRMGIGPVRFTIHDALQMVERGILPEDATIELLEGELVYRDRFDLRGDHIVEGVRHNYVITALGDLQIRVNDGRRDLRTQSTLICSDTHAPIPDAVVLRGTLDDYSARLPSAADAWCVVEVADSSYERDTGEKLAGYARAGVAQYIVINLRNRTAEVYTHPDPAAGTYPAPRVVREAEILHMRVGEEEVFAITLSEVLP
jgi:putative restriction endonuclease